MYATEELQETKKRNAPLQRKNKDQIAVASVEHVTGKPLGHMEINHNSSFPKAVGADACTQGNKISLAPGQGRHVFHELVHGTQTNVKPTGMVNGHLLNDSPKLEKEADVKGKKAEHVAKQNGW